MTRRDIPSLDGWRALAVVLVMLTHAGYTGQLWGPATGIGRWVVTPVDLGVLGVRIFFVLSGFLITRLLIAEYARTGRIALGLFYFRRTFRLAPPLLVYLAVMAALAAAGVLQINASDILASATYLRDYFGNSWYTGHLWSLAVEEQFYLLWPAAVVLWRAQAWRAALAVVALAPVARLVELWHYTWQNTWPVDSHFETVADALAIGVLLAYASDVLANRLWYRRWHASPAPYVLFATAYAGLWSGWVWHAKVHAVLGLPLTLVSIALLIDWTVRRPDTIVGRVLNTAPLRWIGRISYSLYLWQQFAMRSNALAWPRVAVTVPGVYLLALALAVLSYYGVEQPALRARDRVLAWQTARRALGRSGTPILKPTQ